MVLKRLTTLALVLVLLNGIFAPAGASAHTRGIIDFEREVFATVTDKLTGRAGPGTGYIDLGTYNLTGQKVRAISYAYDSSNRCWIMIELPERSGRRFMYVNSSRLKGYNRDRLFSESELALNAEETVRASSPVLCSPYDNSEAYEGIVLNDGDTVKVIALMDEYKLIEIASGEQKLRGWMPLSAFGQSSRERIDPSNANLVVTRYFEVYDESSKEDYTGRINEKGEWIQRCSEGEMGQFINGIAYAQRGGYNGNFGYIDENGDEFLPFQWKNATDFIDGLAWVQNDEGKYGCINLQGEMVYPFEWDAAFSCGEGLSWVRKGTTVSCLNKNGDLRFQVDTEYEYDELGMHATKLWNGYAMFYTEDVICCVNANGDEIFQVSLGNDAYDCGISSLYRELSAITVDGKQIFINEDMELVIPAELGDSVWPIYRYYDFDRLALPDGSYVFSYPYAYQEGLRRVYKDGKFGYESLATGELVIPYEYTMTLPFNNGLAMVCRDGDETRTRYSEGDTGKFGFINAAGREVIPCEWDSCLFAVFGYPFSGGANVTLMGKDGSFYLVDINGNVSPWEWDTEEKPSDYLFSDGLCRVSKDGLYGYMDIDGSLVIPFEWEYAEDFSEGLAVVGKDGKKWYINTKGETAFQHRYSNADSFDNGYAAVYQDGIGDIIDLSGNVVARDVGLVHRIVPIGDSMLALGADAGSWIPSFTGDNFLCDYMVVTLGGELVLGEATPIGKFVGNKRVYFPNFPVGSMLEFYEAGTNYLNKYGFLNTSTGEVLWCNGHIWKDGILYLYNDGVISAYDMEGNPLPHLTVDLNR